MNPAMWRAYETLKVDVAGVGSLQDWWLPAAPGMPTVVFFHGNGGNKSSFVETANRLHRRGWGALLTEYPGFSGAPGKPSEDTIMASAREDIAIVAKRGPIVVWGHSLGSGVAAQMASEGLAQGLVLEAPYTSLSNVAAARYPYLPMKLIMLDRFNTRSILSRIRVPVLIFHSDDDQEIPFAMGEIVGSELGPRATFVRMHGVGHFPHRQDLSSIVFQWADTHCFVNCAARFEADTR